MVGSAKTSQMPEEMQAARRCSPSLYRVGLQSQPDDYLSADDLQDNPRGRPMRNTIRKRRQGIPSPIILGARIAQGYGTLCRGERCALVVWDTVTRQYPDHRS